MSNIFAKVSGLRPGRSYFDLSYSKIFDCNAGELIPVLCDEVVPGDYVQLGSEVVVRMQPMVAPILHAINLYVHYFSVPYRLLWPEWEEFITGGVDGESEAVLPRWTPTDNSKGSQWDYFGFPLVLPPGLSRPMVFPLRAYKFIYNEFYRDETLQSAYDIMDDNDVGYPQGSPLKRDWRKDYFTSALPWQQRGIAPAIPISGTTKALWPATDFGAIGGASVDPMTFNNSVADKVARTNSGPAASNAQAFFQDNTVDLSSATSITISELRTSVQIQKWLERNARAGVRYTEFLQEHFAVSPTDERLQRPEYIGGSKQPLIISEVLNTTSASDGSKPQGTMAGHGLSASVARAARYHVKEFGLIMGIMSIMPELAYNSQGINRQWLRRDRYDFYFPEFAHLSEQAIEREEIFASAVEADNRQIWGYQGRYDEMRVKRSMTAGNMRDTLSYWHMARTFSSAPALNEDFLAVDGKSTDLTRIFAVPSEPGYMVHFGNVFKALRPMPAVSNPGMMDHF